MLPLIAGGALDADASAPVRVALSEAIADLCPVLGKDAAQVCVHSQWFREMQRWMRGCGWIVASRPKHKSQITVTHQSVRSDHNQNHPSVADARNQCPPKSQCDGQMRRVKFHHPNKAQKIYRLGRIFLIFLLHCQDSA